LIHFPDHQVIPVGRLVPPKGQAHFYHGICLLGVGLGSVHLALALLDEPNADSWPVVSDEPTDLTTLAEYGLRFDWEENFLDDKSNGFQVEASRLDTPAALERLFLVLAVATLHLTSVEVGVVRRKLRQWLDTHWDRGMSYLKIGWSRCANNFAVAGRSCLPSGWTRLQTLNQRWPRGAKPPAQSQYGRSSSKIKFVSQSGTVL
jgi:hypothetical protein